MPPPPTESSNAWPPPMPTLTRQISGERSRHRSRTSSRSRSRSRSGSRERHNHESFSRIREDIAVLMSPSPWTSGNNGVGPGSRDKLTCNKYVLFVTGLVTTFLQGGLIFGFTAFEDKVLNLPNSPFNADTASAIFAIGHNITAWGCILSGLVLDKFGPRKTAASGLLIEALGHFIMLKVYDVPTWLVHVGYGMIGIGGCQVLLAALTFAEAFQNAALVTSWLTATFQAGGFVFMILPAVDWSLFFGFYVVLCIAGAVITGFLYPDLPLPAYSDDDECSDIAGLTSAMASGGTLRSILLRSGTLWFMATFCVAGSAWTYGYGEFAAALKEKDDCRINELGQEVCANKGLQDMYNNVLMPIVGNFILPCATLLGWIIDRSGFGWVALINISFVQVFIVCLWLLPLEATAVTMVVFNVANTAVFTVQNAYICSVGNAHIGSLFSISNFVLGAGNLIASWMSLNPFGTEDKVSTSIDISCVVWLVATTPLYYWVIVEFRRFYRTQRGLEQLQQSVCSSCAGAPVASSVASSGGRSFAYLFSRGAATATNPSDQNPNWTSNNSPGPGGTGEGAEAHPRRPPEPRTSVTPLLQGAQGAHDLEMNAQGVADYVADRVRSLSSGQVQSRDLIPSNVILPRIEYNLVVTVNPPAWERKVQHVLEAGHEKVFLVLDFDRTVTRCFLEDGSKSLDCHDILASIPKITRDCRQKMEDMMEKYYPIEIHPTMTREEKVPYIAEWYSMVNALLAAQNITRDDVSAAVAGCKRFCLRSGVQEVFGIANRRRIPIVILSAGLGNVIEEVILQKIWTPQGKKGDDWPNVRVLSNTLQWDENGNHTGFSEPLIHMYNKSLQDAPGDLRKLIEGRHVGILCGDAVNDVHMAQGHETSELLKVGFLNEKAEQRLPNYIGPGGYDRVVLYDGTYEPVLEVLRRL